MAVIYGLTYVAVLVHLDGQTFVVYVLTYIAILGHLDGQTFVEVMRWCLRQQGGHFYSDVYCFPRASGWADIRQSRELALAAAWRSRML